MASKNSNFIESNISNANQINSEIFSLKNSLISNKNFIQNNSLNNSQIFPNLKISKISKKNFEEDKNDKNPNLLLSQEIEIPKVNSLLNKSLEIKKNLFKVQNLKNFQSENFQNQATNNLNILKKRTYKKRSKEWSELEDEKLSDLINNFGKRNWKEISSHFRNKGRKDCYLRWRKVLSKNKQFLEKEKLHKLKVKMQRNNSWSMKDDKVILKWVSTVGVKNWTKCSKLFNGKSPKECKERWFNKLYFENIGINNDINLDIWTKKDEFLIALFIKKFGTCWSKFQNFFPQKSATQIKNKFYCLLRFFNKEDSNSNSSNSNSSNSNSENSNIFSNEFFDKFIFFLIDNEDEYVKRQNLNIFLDAKKLFFLKLKEIWQKNNKNAKENFNNFNNNNFTNSEENKINNNNNTLKEHKNNCLKNLKNLDQIKELAICNKCMNLLRSHIKNKLIQKLKNSKISLNLNNNLNKKENNDYIGNENGNGNNNEIPREMDLEIIENIPELFNAFDFIRNIKEKIME